jgi:peptidoglycan LD-endopeptidase LytH
MRRPPSASGRSIPVFACGFLAGMVVGWWLRSGPPVPAFQHEANVVLRGQPEDVPADAHALAHAGAPSDEPTFAAKRSDDDAITELEGRDLRVPVDHVAVNEWKGMFAERRAAGHRTHEAVDIPAPRGTPVHAVEDGTIARLFYSKAGGNTIYQFDPTQRFCYYYAHLDTYASGLGDNRHVQRGDILAYVGTSGNAAGGTPHLHFAIFELGSARHWWQGRPLDPYLVFRRAQP